MKKNKIHKKKYLRKLNLLLKEYNDIYHINNSYIYLDINKLQHYIKKSNETINDSNRPYSIRKTNILVKNRAILLVKILNIAIELKYDNDKLIQLFNQNTK